MPKLSMNSAKFNGWNEEKQNRKHRAIFGLGRVLSLIQCRGAGYIDFAQVRVAEVIES